MEIEEVAAHNAEIYNPGSAQRRKREKAQDQLRNRMRKRNNGTSSSMVSARSLRSSQHKSETTAAAGLRTVWNNGKHNSASQEWGQEPPYGTLAHPGRLHGMRHRQGEVPLTELVGRVMQRRGHMTTQSSPMTIRALKPPAPPYAIQHPALIRKIQPINKRKPTSGGPYVVVLNRSSASKKSDQTDTCESRDLPPLKQPNNSTDVEIATWRPELTTTHTPYVHPNAEDRSVTNYRLQMQQAIKIAELRGDFSVSSKPMHKHAPLPAIQVAYEVADNPQVAKNSTEDGYVVDTVAEKLPADQQPQSDSMKSVSKESPEKMNRFTTSQEVLKQMQARKQAKRRKAKGNDFNNPLRTRNRFTTKMKMFKEDLQKARELSMIQEDQSSISERLSRLSAGRASVASFRSVGSLKRIEESDVPGYSNRLSEKQKVLGAIRTSKESNTDKPSGMEDLDTITPSDGTNTSEYDSIVNSQKVLTSPCSDVSANDKVINDADDASKTDCVADSVGQTAECQVGTQEPEPITDHGSKCETCKTRSEVEQNLPFVSETSDSSALSPISDNVHVTDDSDENVSIANIPIASVDQSTDVVGDSPANDLNLPCDNDIVSSNEEDPPVAMETRLAVDQQSVDSHKETDSGRGIATDTFDMRDIILPAETVQ